MASRRENILENIRTTLASITTGNGYNTDIVKVTRAVRRPDLRIVDFTDNPQAFVIDGPEALVEMTNKHMAAIVGKDDGGLLVEIYVIMSSSSSTTINALIEDVKKAIYADTTRGGYAIHTKLPHNEIQYDRDYPYNTVIFSCRVLYDYPADTP
jgi:hypothetical protein